MKSVLFVGEGATEQQCLPALLAWAAPSATVGEKSAFKAWADIPARSGKGGPLGKKLQLALQLARHAGHDAVVASIDTDDRKRGERLTELDTARRPIDVPSAIGEATPHFEAWILGDSKAVRDALALPSESQIPAPTRCDPKTALADLCRRSSTEFRTSPDAMVAVIRRMDLRRCTHARETGLADFNAELTRVFGPPQDDRAPSA